MRRLRWTILSMVVACSSVEPPPSSAPVRLVVTVRDDAGAIVPNVALRVWRRDKGADIPLFPPESPTVRSDAQGQAVLEIPSWAYRHAAESLTVAIDPHFCQGLAPDTLVVPIRSEGESQDHAEATFRSAREAPLTRLEVGVSCGVRFPSYRTTLRLAFDTVGTVLTGDWFLSHSQSIAPQEGRFSGLRVQDVIHITLYPEAPACDGVFVFTARVKAAGELTDAELTGEGGCFVERAPSFFLVRRDLGDWP